MKRFAFAILLLIPSFAHSRTAIVIQTPDGRKQYYPRNDTGGGSGGLPLPAGDTTYLELDSSQTVTGQPTFTSTETFKGGIQLSGALSLLGGTLSPDTLVLGATGGNVAGTNDRTIKVQSGFGFANQTSHGRGLVIQAGDAQGSAGANESGGNLYFKTGTTVGNYSGSVIQFYLPRPGPAGTATMILSRRAEFSASSDTFNFGDSTFSLSLSPAASLNSAAGAVGPQLSIYPAGVSVPWYEVNTASSVQRIPAFIVGTVTATDTISSTTGFAGGGSTFTSLNVNGPSAFNSTATVNSALIIPNASTAAFTDASFLLYTTGVKKYSLLTSSVTNIGTQYKLAFTTNGVITSSGIAPALTTCGTSPTVAGNDRRMIVTVGATGGGCTITFAVPFLNAPTCLVSPRTGSVINALTITDPTNTALTFSETGAGGNKFDIWCDGLGE